MSSHWSCPSRLTASSPKVRGPLTVQAVATPAKSTPSRKAQATALAATAHNQVADPRQQHESLGRALVAENNLHNSFYLPYHYMLQDNILMLSAVDAKTYSAYDSSWNGSSYL